MKTQSPLGGSDDINEQSPLLLPRENEEPVATLPSQSLSDRNEDEQLRTQGTSDSSLLKSRSNWYLFLLTICMFGLQISWSTEFAYGSPYLLSLGISKSLLAFVWIAAPLSGILVAPFVGAKSDQCRSRFGKRRPFMVAGGAATITCFMALAWAKEIVEGIFAVFGASGNSPAIATTAIVFAVLLIYILDFAVNTVQAATRAFIVDNVPVQQQASANAWAARISGLGNILGYLFGYIDLPRYFWFAGDTQFKILCAFASLAVVVTLSVSCLSIKEKDARQDGKPLEHGGTFAVFRSLWHSASRLPAQIRNICLVQFFAWIGWFPFLFYITTYVGGIYTDHYFAENPNMSHEEIEETWQRGTRAATFAMFIYSIVSFAASIVFPFAIANAKRSGQVATGASSVEDEVERQALVTPGDGDAIADTPIPAANGTSKQRVLSDLIPSARITRHSLSSNLRWITIRNAWLCSHILFFFLTWLTLFVRTIAAASVLVAALGMSWALTNWAPFALIAAEIRKRSSNYHSDQSRGPSNGDNGPDTEDTADQAGVILGIHNVSIAAPQVIASLVSSVLFQALQKPRGTVGDNSVAWTLRFGGVCALVAAWLTTRVANDLTD